MILGFYNDASAGYITVGGKVIVNGEFEIIIPAFAY
jgi:hypothetical protein